MRGSPASGASSSTRQRAVEARGQALADLAQLRPRSCWKLSNSHSAAGLMSPPGLGFVRHETGRPRAECAHCSAGAGRRWPGRSGPARRGACCRGCGHAAPAGPHRRARIGSALAPCPGGASSMPSTRGGIHSHRARRLASAIQRNSHKAPSSRVSTSAVETTRADSTCRRPSAPDRRSRRRPRRGAAVAEVGAQGAVFQGRCAGRSAQRSGVPGGGGKKVCVSWSAPVWGGESGRSARRTFVRIGGAMVCARRTDLASLGPSLTVAKKGWTACVIPFVEPFGPPSGASP